jgi:hypothetical protein
MSKLEAYRFLSNQHRGISFVANVILTRGGPNGAKRLKKMVKLIKEGRELGDGSFSCEHFSVDGRILPLSALDTL